MSGALSRALGDHLPPKKEKAVQLLARGLSIADAAIQGGYAQESLRIWLKKDELFQGRFRELVALARERFEARIGDLADKAATVVEKKLDDEKSLEHFDAAKTVLHTQAKLVTRVKEVNVREDLRMLLVFPPGTAMNLDPGFGRKP